MHKVLSKASYERYSDAFGAAASFNARQIFLLADTVIGTVSFFLIRAVFLLCAVYFSINPYRIKSRPDPKPAG